jgi:hypothetical protein
MSVAESLLVTVGGGTQVVPLEHLITEWQHLCAHKLEQRALKNVNNCLNTNIYSYLETLGGQSCNLYLDVVHFLNTSVN